MRSRQLKLRRNGQKGQERGIPLLPLLENTNRHPKNSLRSIPCEYRVMTQYQYVMSCVQGFCQKLFRIICLTNYVEHALKKKTHATVTLNFLPRLSESSQRKRKKIEATVPNPAMTGIAKGRLKCKNGKKKRERKSVAMSKVRVS